MEQTLTHSKLTDGMRNWTPEEVFALEEQVKALQEQPGWKAILQFIEDSRTRVHVLIESPRTLEQATYARLGGFLAGLALVAETPRNVIEKAEKTRQELLEIGEEAEANA